MTTKETVFSKDLQNKKITIVRSFDASLDLVWRAWTESEILDEWWAPKPYRAVTKTMDFREGGMWLYAMVGPENDQQWCKEDFKTISAHKKITNSVCFCDEKGKENASFPVMHWKKEFSEKGAETTVNVEISFPDEAAMEMLAGMGFQEGFTAGLSNLDQYLSKRTGSGK